MKDISSFVTFPPSETRGLSLRAVKLYKMNLPVFLDLVISLGRVP